MRVYRLLDAIGSVLGGLIAESADEALRIGRKRHPRAVRVGEGRLTEFDSIRELARDSELVELREDGRIVFDERRGTTTARLGSELTTDDIKSAVEVRAQRLEHPRGGTRIDVVYRFGCPHCTRVHSVPPTKYGMGVYAEYDPRTYLGVQIAECGLGVINVIDDGSKPEKAAASATDPSKESTTMSPEDKYRNALAESLEVFGISEKTAKRVAGVTDPSTRTLEGSIADSLSIFGISEETAKRIAHRDRPVEPLDHFEESSSRRSSSPLRLFQLLDAQGEELGTAAAADEPEALRLWKARDDPASQAVRAVELVSDFDPTKYYYPAGKSRYPDNTKPPHGKPNFDPTKHVVPAKETADDKATEAAIAESLSVYGIKPETAKRVAAGRGPR